MDLLQYVKKNYPKNVSSGTGDAILDIGHSKLENAVFGQTNCVFIFADSLFKEIVSNTKENKLFVPLSLIDIADGVFEYVKYVIETRPLVDFIVFGCEITPAIPCFLRAGAATTSSGAAFSQDVGTSGFDTLDPSRAYDYFIGTSMYSSENDILGALADKHTLPLLYSIIFKEVLRRFADFAPNDRNVVISVMYPLLEFAKGSLNLADATQRTPNSVKCNMATDDIFVKGVRTVRGIDISGRQVLHEKNIFLVSNDGLHVGEPEQQMVWILDSLCKPALQRKSFINLEIVCGRCGVNWVVSPLLYIRDLFGGDKKLLAGTLGLTWVNLNRMDQSVGYVNDLVDIAGIAADLDEVKTDRLVCGLTFFYSKYWNFMDTDIEEDDDLVMKTDFGVDFAKPVKGIYSLTQNTSDFENAVKEIYTQLSSSLDNDYLLFDKIIVNDETGTETIAKPYHIDSSFMNRILQNEFTLNRGNLGANDKIKMIFPSNWDVAHTRQDVFPQDTSNVSLPRLPKSVLEDFFSDRPMLHVGIFDEFRMHRNKLVFVWLLAYARWGYTELFSGLAPVNEDTSSLLEDAGFELKKDSLNIVVDILPVFEYSSSYASSFKNLGAPQTTLKISMTTGTALLESLVERILRNCPLFLGISVDGNLKLPSHIDPVDDSLAYLLYRHLMQSMHRLEVVAADKIALMNQIDPTWFSDFVDVVMSETEIADEFTTSTFNDPNSPWVIYVAAIETQKKIGQDEKLPAERIARLKEDVVVFLENQADLHIVYPNDFMCLMFVYGKMMVSFDELLPLVAVTTDKCKATSRKATVSSRLLHAPFPFVKVQKSDGINKCSCFSPLAKSGIPRRISALESADDLSKIYKVSDGDDLFEYRHESILTPDAMYNTYMCEVELPVDQNLSRMDSFASFMTPLTVYSSALLAAESSSIAGGSHLRSKYVPHRVMWAMLMDGGANSSDVVRGMTHKLLTKAGVFVNGGDAKYKDATKSTLSCVPDVCFYALPYLSRDYDLSTDLSKWTDAMWKTCSIFGPYMQTSWFSLLSWKIAQSIYFRSLNRRFLQERQAQIDAIENSRIPLLGDIVATSIYTVGTAEGTAAVARKLKRKQNIVENVTAAKIDAVQRIVSNIVTEHVFVYHMNDLNLVGDRIVKWFSTWIFAFYHYKRIISLVDTLSIYSEVIDNLCEAFPSVDDLYFYISPASVDIYFENWSENIILHYIQHSISTVASSTKKNIVFSTTEGRKSFQVHIAQDVKLQIKFYF